MATDVVNGRILKKMVTNGLLTEADATSLLQEKEQSKASMTELILKLHLVESSKLAAFLATELGCASVDLDEINPDDELIQLIPPQFARRYQVFPVARQDNTLTVAMGNPADVPLIDDLQTVTGLKIVPVLALPPELKKAVNERYPATEQKNKVSSEEMIQKLARMVQEKQGDDLEQETVNLIRLAQETPVIKVANIFLLDAIRKKASDLFIEPWENELRVRCRVDGVLEEIYTPPKAIALALVSRFKVMSQLNIAERRIPQDGRFKIKVQDREVDIRVSIIPTTFGEKVCLRILDKKSQANELDKLGFTEKDIQMIKDSSLKPHGMILVTGPTGSGKTTTLYSVLKFLDLPEKNITTVEDPVEYEADGINQVNVRDSIGLTFPAALRSILRQDPDIILIGEIRDLTTMDIAIKAALTGHLVLSTLHTNDTIGSIVRILNMGIEPFLITSSLIMISAQRLVRKLCEHCKSTSHADEDVIDQLGLDRHKHYTFYRPVGCVKCRTAGYKGRSVISEILMLTPDIKAMIMSRASGEEIKQRARRQGMSTLRESGVEKALAGVTSLDEVFRVTAGDQELEVE